MSPSFFSIMSAGVSWCLRAPELTEVSWSRAEWRCVRGSERRQWQTLVSMAADQEAMFHGRDVTMPPRDWMVEATESTNNYATNYYISTYNKSFFTSFNSDIWCKFLLRGSRTSSKLCKCNPLMAKLMRQCPKVVDAQYTKNQAWRSVKDILGTDSPEEVSPESHCQYKYLFNYSGVAAKYSTLDDFYPNVCSTRCRSSRGPLRCCSRTRTEGGATLGWIYIHISLL